MTYAEAMAFVDSTKHLGSKLGLDNITELMHELKDMQDLIHIVHITGTNGKGSVGAMLSTVLVESGYRVGRFDSPAVFSYEEAFLMNGEPIGKQRLADVMEQVKAACERMVARGCDHPTSFEIETAAAFVWFYEENADLVLLEVGMGGATDSTNVIRHPDVSVFVPISMDHMQFLGNSLAEIATVKAGIIKQGCPAVSAVQKPEAARVLQEVCQKQNAALYMADESRIELLDMNARGMRFLWQSSQSDHKQEYTLGVSGMYQLENAGCALEVLDVLRTRYERITDDTIQQGLLKVRWPGRFEQIGEKPQFFIDGAHNAAAAIQLRDTLDCCFKEQKITFIMGVLADKEYDKIIATMLREGDCVFTITPPNPRALLAADLADYLEKQGISAQTCETISDAVSKAVEAAGEDGVVLAFGSLYYLKLIREAYQTIKR